VKRAHDESGGNYKLLKENCCFTGLSLWDSSTIDSSYYSNDSAFDLWSTQILWDALFIWRSLRIRQ